MTLVVNFILISNHEGARAVLFTPFFSEGEWDQCANENYADFDKENCCQVDAKLANDYDGNNHLPLGKQQWILPSILQPMIHHHQHQQKCAMIYWRQRFAFTLNAATAT
jgi:hypothetical protein